MLLIALIIYFAIQSIKNKKYFFILFLIILWLLSIFSLNIVLGDKLVLRANLVFAFYPAFIILFIITLFANSNKSILYKYICVIISIIIIVFHSYNIVKNQTAYYLTYKSEVIKITLLMEKIYNKYPEIYNGKYKIIFVGRQSIPKHPYMKGKGNMSFAITSNYDRSWRIVRFLQLHGFPMNVKVGKVTDEINEIVSKMPSFPNNDCVQLYKDTVIVRL